MLHPMQTTITLEDDVAARQRQTGQSFEEIVNHTLRLGLERQSPRPRFKVVARPLGVRPGLNDAKVGDLLDQIQEPISPDTPGCADAVPPPGPAHPQTGRPAARPPRRVA